MGLLAEGLVGRGEEVGVCPLAGTTDPATQLVELSEAQQVGPVHDQGVHRRHVDPRLDDRGAHQHVVHAFPEVHDGRLQRRLVHLAVCHHHPCLRNQLPDAGSHAVDVLDPVVHEEDLALPEQLAADGLGHRPLVVVPHVGQDRLPVGGRRVQEAEVPYACQRHLQGARDGGGRQGEHVHVGPDLLDRLLVADPEALLLVDDQQAQPLEPDLLGEQAVRADHHVHRPVGQALGDTPRRRRGQESTEHLHPDRIRGEAVAEGLAVLLGQEGGRHQHGRLTSVLHGLERGSDRHLRLAEAHVAAHQAVHRHGALHVRLDVLDGLQLVRRLLVGKGLFHLPLPGSVGGEGVADRRDPGLVQDDQFLGDLRHLGAHLGPGPVPVGAAHPAEARSRSTRVGPDAVDLVRRQVEAVVAPVLEQQVVALDARQGAGDQPGEAGHAVLFVDDVVAG